MSGPDEDDLPVIKKEERRHNAAITVAKIHVPFSSTSEVCLTPMNWLLIPAMFPVNPPPLGFWIKTIKPSITEANMIRIMNNVVMSDFFL